MNTNDLRQVLHEDADEAPVLPVSELMAGIQREIKIRQRNRWASIAVAAATILAVAIGVVPRMVDSSAPEPVEPPPVHPSGPPFPERMWAGDLVASHVSTSGDTEFTWQQTITEQHVDVVMYCIVPNKDWTPGMVAVAWLDDTYYKSVWCARRGETHPPVWKATLHTADWGRRLRHQPGQTHSVTVRLYAEDGANTSKVDLGLALYAGAGPEPGPPDSPVPSLTMQFLRQLDLSSPNQ